MDKAILVGLDYKMDIDIEVSMQELKSLADACEIESVGHITQSLKQPTANFYIGSGKVNEIKSACELHDIDLVIFNDELSPSHIRNLEEVLEVKVIDRTILILDIFARRAKTKEAMLQVEIAQLRYMLPRLIGLTKSLNRQQGGVGSRGPGEKKLETDRRRIESQIAKLRRELKDVVKSRETSRRQRKEEKVVALVGYTNAGKSSFLNVMVGQNEEKSVLEKDMLFATLETSTRKVYTKNNQKFLLTDTVGFVHKLPHHLVDAFKSTLEEVTEADLLIHLVDISNEEYRHQVEVTNQVLDSIGASEVEMVYALNKIDVCDTQGIGIDGFKISCKTGEGVDELVREIESRLFDLVKVELLIPFDEMSILNMLKNDAVVLNEEYLVEGCKVETIVNQRQYNLVKKHKTQTN
jgi:GTP-binding protein HflX